MKVPPKRKGNKYDERHSYYENETLNESPSEKEGKCGVNYRTRLVDTSPQ